MRTPSHPKNTFSVDFHSGIFALLFSSRTKVVDIWHPALHISLQQWGFDVQIILYLWHITILTSSLQFQTAAIVLWTFSFLIVQDFNKIDFC